MIVQVLLEVVEELDSCLVRVETEVRMVQVAIQVLEVLEAAHVYGRLFQHQNLFGAVLSRRNTGGEGGVARPDNNDIVISQLFLPFL